MKIEERHYTKKELAILCNPGMTFEAASQKFRRDVYGCKELMKLLRMSGYRKRKKYLRYTQVLLILKHVYPDQFET